MITQIVEQNKKFHYSIIMISVAVHHFCHINSFKFVYLILILYYSRVLTFFVFVFFYLFVCFYLDLTISIWIIFFYDGILFGEEFIILNLYMLRLVPFAPYNISEYICKSMITKASIWSSGCTKRHHCQVQPTFLYEFYFIVFFIIVWAQNLRTINGVQTKNDSCLMGSFNKFCCTSK